MRETNSNFETFQNAINLIYNVCAMWEVMIWTTFTIVSMGRITGVEFRKSQNVQNKLEFRKVSKRCKSDIHSVLNVGNDDLNNVQNSYHGAHHRSRNFVKAKICKTNSNFEKFQNALNLIYKVCAKSDMLIWTTFTIVSMVRITGVEISSKPKCAKQTPISKSFKNLWMWYTHCAQYWKWWFKLCLPYLAWWASPE